MTAKRKAKAKPKRGRPTSSNPQSSRIIFRATPDATERYKAAAQAEGMTLAAWLKMLADAAARQ